jgi:hypothetical protein
MSDQVALWSWVHRANIERYRRILTTPLTPTERQFIEQRICEEEVALRGTGGFVELPTLPTAAARQLAPEHPREPQ